VAPHLAQVLQDVSCALEQGAFRNVSETLSDTQRRVSLEQETVHYRHLNNKWQATLGEVQQLDGFEDFLRPNSLAKLKRAAANGPVVILNSSKSESSALIMTLSGVEHVPLPKFTVEIAWMLVKLIQVATSMENFPLAKSQLKALMHHTRSLLEPLYGDDRGSMQATKIAASPDDIFKSVLEILWTSVAEPIIHCLALTVR